MKGWNKLQISQHLEASKRVMEVHFAGFEFIKDNPDTNEFAVQQFIHKEFKKRKLVSHAPQIVAFGPSIASPHYTPTKNKKQKLKENQLVEFDLWARLTTKGAPFTDMTWMGFYGKKLPAAQKKAFDVLLKARDTGVRYVKNRIKDKELPTGHDIDAATNKVLIDNGHKKHIKHSTGHPLGFVSPHGRGRNINRTNVYSILENVPYTIEPGIYVDRKFGMRSEIDIMVTKKREFLFTSPVQKKLIYLS